MIQVIALRVIVVNTKILQIFNPSLKIIIIILKKIQPLILIDGQLKCNVYTIIVTRPV